LYTGETDNTLSSEHGKTNDITADFLLHLPLSDIQRVYCRLCKFLFLFYFISFFIFRSPISKESIVGSVSLCASVCARAHLYYRFCKFMCECVCARSPVCVCVCVRARALTRKGGRLWKKVCVWVCASVCLLMNITHFVSIQRAPIITTPSQNQTTPRPPPPHTHLCRLWR
jgi:hypothetical protein